MSKQLRDVYVVAATRTPIGKSGRGVFKNTRPDDLLVATIKNALKQVPSLDPAAIEEGGRHTPFFKGYRPQFYFRTTDVTGTIQLPDGVEMVMPGDNIKMVVELIAPIAMEDGLRFAIREGGRTVGAGVVAKILV